MNQHQYIREASKKYGITFLGILVCLMLGAMFRVPQYAAVWIMYELSVLAFRIGRLHLVYSSNKQIDIKVSEVE